MQGLQQGLQNVINVAVDELTQGRSHVQGLRNVITGAADELKKGVADARICLVSGAIAKAVAISTMHPIDTIKTRNQLCPEQLALLPPLKVKHIFRGIKTSLFGAVPYGAITFASYEVIKTKMLTNFGEKVRPEILLVQSAVMADLIGSLWVCPADMMKIGTQSGMYKSTLEACRSILKAHGPMGFYQGFAGHVIRDVPFRAIQLPVFDVMKTAYLAHKEEVAVKKAEKERERRIRERAEAAQKAVMRKKTLRSRVYAKVKPTPAEELTDEVLVRTVQPLDPLESMVIGTFASVIAAAATAPLDLLRTRLMTAHLPDQGVVTTLRALSGIARDIVRHEGPAEFFRGTGLRVAYMGPTCGLFFLVFEASKNTLYQREKEFKKKKQLLAGLA
jgi:hypothetical protein